MSKQYTMTASGSILDSCGMTLRPITLCTLLNDKDQRLKVAQEHIKELEAQLANVVELPKITDEIAEDYYPLLIDDDGEGFSWNQEAVNFACLLKYKESE